MEDGVANGEGTRTRAIWAGVLALAATVLAASWLWVRADAASLEERSRLEAEKIEKVKRHIEANYAALMGRGEAAESSPLASSDLLTVVKDTAARCGLADRIARVIEEENPKLNEVTAKVTLRGLRMADVVNFLAVLKREYPGVYDREGRMQYARGGDADNWDVTLSLTARKPA